MTAATIIQSPARFVIASEAKQSIAPRKERMDCFVAEPVIGLAKGETRWLLAMTSLHGSAGGMEGNP
jgi:hypothetical protein